MKKLLLLPLLLASSLVASPLDTIQIQRLDGQPFDTAALQGKVVLFVNVASRCGFTRQYTGLQELYAKYKDRGLVVVGVPSNDFGGQEPGSAEEIAQFCQDKYSVDFPMTEKVHVKGEKQHPLYVYLTQDRSQPKWNFHKYLVDRTGKVIADYPSKVAPDNSELISTLENALAK